MFRSRRLRCSFCGKGEAEVEKLVAGPRVFICDGCVAVASRLMDAPTGGDNQPPAVRQSVCNRVTEVARRIWRGGAARVADAGVV